ncbi:MAG TPA: glycoside hydrolase family 5 protein [Labilithrix sp.]|nr:glycoside hydrolase family 5 protein [Labilithrix sp.]
MPISCTWTRRATAIAGFLLLGLATACGSADAGTTTPDGAGGDEAPPALYGITSTSTTPAARRDWHSTTVAPTPTSPSPGTTTTGSLRGTNLIGMEGGYGFNQATGPIPNTDYAVHSNDIVDYLASRSANVIRLLFSWERMQSTLGGPVPAAASGNYKAYFDDFKRIVDYATLTKGMTVIVEPWQASASGGVGGPSWRGNLVGNGVVTKAHFADFWSKMAATYAANPRVVIGLVNEPNTMSTMIWFDAAQAAITAIRGAGFTGDIHVPGNGWTGAGSWNDSSPDTAATKRSNAYGWMNARGTNLPLLDPLGKLVAAVHTYADADASGGSTAVLSGTISRERVKGVVDWARASGLKVFLGEIGMYASAPNAAANWADFIAYLDDNADTLGGYAWWGCGKPGWWNDVAASGGGHFSITPTGTYDADTVNMKMIQASLHP